MKYKLIVSDLDGTLIASDLKVSKENFKAISDIQKIGIEFTVSSGRTFYEIPKEVREYPAIRYIAYSNGTAVYDKALGRDIIENRISRECINEVFDIISDYDTRQSVHVSGESYFTRGTFDDASCKKYQINDYYKILLNQGVALDSHEALARSSDGVEAVVMFFANDNELIECKRRLEELSELTVTSSIAHNIEICSSKAGKGEALSALARHLGIPSDEVIAVGDNSNDISMFDYAGLSVCAGNGSEGAKASADVIACTADENVAEYLYKNILAPMV